MDILNITLFVIFIFGVAAVMLLGESKVPVSHPYQAKGCLLTAAERSFLGVLDKTVGDNARIFSQVRIADVLSVRKDLSRSDWQTAQNKINSKHVDFVICDPSTLSLLCAIELNDKSHEKRKRIERDEFVESAFKAANIPLIWIKAKKGYSVDEIGARLSPYVNIHRACRQKGTL